jgi:hypothetical protein
MFGRFVGKAFALMGLALLPVLGHAAEGDPVTLIDTGANVTGHITAAITALGAVAAVAIGGYFAFLVIRKGIRWAGRMS